MKIENKTLMETLIDAGYPREEMYHHCSDRQRKEKAECCVQFKT